MHNNLNWHLFVTWVVFRCTDNSWT